MIHSYAKEKILLIHNKLPNQNNVSKISYNNYNILKEDINILVDKIKIYK